WGGGRGSVADLDDNAAARGEVGDRVVVDRRVVYVASSTCGSPDADENGGTERVGSRGAARQRVVANVGGGDIAAKFLNVYAMVTGVCQGVVGDRHGATEVRLIGAGHNIKGDVRLVNAATCACVIDRPVSKREIHDLGAARGGVDPFDAAAADVVYAH